MFGHTPELRYAFVALDEKEAFHVVDARGFFLATFRKTRETKQDEQATDLAARWDQAMKILGETAVTIDGHPSATVLPIIGNAGLEEASEAWKVVDAYSGVIKVVDAYCGVIKKRLGN